MVPILVGNRTSQIHGATETPSIAAGSPAGMDLLTGKGDGYYVWINVNFRANFEA